MHLHIEWILLIDACWRWPNPPQKPCGIHKFIFLCPRHIIWMMTEVSSSLSHVVDNGLQIKSIKGQTVSLDILNLWLVHDIWHPRTCVTLGTAFTWEVSVVIHICRCMNSPNHRDCLQPNLTLLPCDVVAVEPNVWQIWRQCNLIDIKKNTCIGIMALNQNINIPNHCKTLKVSTKWIHGQDPREVYFPQRPNIKAVVGGQGL